MADDTTPTTDPGTGGEDATPQAPDQGAQGEPDAALGEGGKKALDAERRRANAAEKSQKALQQRIDALEAEKLSKEERADKRAAEAERERDQARADALRWRIASKHSISDEDADLFLTGTDEETLTRQAERLAERTKTPEGLYVPGEGHQPAPPALNSDSLEGALRQKLGIPG